MAKNNLAPTPIVDKNGKTTTVYKSASNDVPASSFAEVVPAISESPQRVSRLLDVPPLSSSEVVEFLAFYPETRADTHALFRSLSGTTQAVIWRARQSGIIDDDSLTDLLSVAQDDLRYMWNKTPDGVEVADNLIRSTILVAENIVGECPLVDSSMAQWIYGVVNGAGYRGEGNFSTPPRFTTNEEILTVAGVATYSIAARQHNSASNKKERFGQCEYEDQRGHSFFGNTISNPVLAHFVMKHPETGYTLGRFAAERDLGDSKADAQTALDYLLDTSETKSISEGWL